MSKTGIERLEGFKVYEIHDPYYSLIKAKSVSEAIDLYIETVAGESGNRKEIKESLKEIDTMQGVGKYYASYDVKWGESLEEWFEYMLNEESNVLLIDGSVC